MQAQSDEDGSFLNQKWPEAQKARGYALCSCKIKEALMTYKAPISNHFAYYAPGLYAPGFEDLRPPNGYMLVDP